MPQGKYQPRRRNNRFDSTLGFPGEGPSQVAGAKQDRPRVVQGNTLHQKVISLPSQAVSMFVRTKRKMHLIQGPPGPDLSHPLRTGRRLAPSTAQDESRSPTPDGGVEEGLMLESLSDDHNTPAPRQPQAATQLIQSDPIRAPVETQQKSCRPRLQSLAGRSDQGNAKR
jgi:hypothetical protein